MTWIMATWNGQPYTMTMRQFDTQTMPNLPPYVDD